MKISNPCLDMCFKLLICLEFKPYLANYDYKIKGTVMQIEKALINDRLHVLKYLENFIF